VDDDDDDEDVELDSYETPLDVDDFDEYMEFKRTLIGAVTYVWWWCIVASSMWVIWAFQSVHVGLFPFLCFFPLCLLIRNLIFLVVKCHTC
jgi:hypothetical protein